MMALVGIAVIVAAAHPRGVKRLVGLGAPPERFHMRNAVDFADSAIESFEEGSCKNAMSLAAAAQNEAKHSRHLPSDPLARIPDDPFYEEMVELNDWVRSQCSCTPKTDVVPDRFKQIVNKRWSESKHGLSSIDDDYSKLNETIEEVEDILSSSYTADAKIEAPFGLLGFRKYKIGGTTIRGLVARAPGEDWVPIVSGKSAIVRAQALQLLPALESELRDSSARRNEEIARGLLVGRQWIQSKRAK